MKTLFSGISGNSFRKAFAAVALVAAVAVAPAVSAQSVTAQDNAPSITKAADEFQAFVHPVENSVSMKVHFVNPEKENIIVTIYNQDNDIVYQKFLGKDAIFHGGAYLRSGFAESGKCWQRTRGLRHNSWQG